jgi:hypothetical protein
MNINFDYPEKFKIVGYKLFYCKYQCEKQRENQFLTSNKI